MEKPTIAFFGATGGCTVSCLAPSLNAGYQCTALARTPQKLKDLLRERGVSDATVEACLTIVTGSISDEEAVRKTLVSRYGRPVGLIICGIGGKMVFDNPLKPTLDNPTICQDAMRIILASARAVQKAQLLDVADGVSNPKPRLVTLSTTGISSTRDLPCLMKPMYHWMLKVPHDDKHVMETLIKGEMAKPLADRGIDNFVIVRPSLLTDGKGDGLHKIKAGTAENPAVGYVICRNDVGAWLFENLVRGFYGETYVGQIVTITA